MVLKRLAYTSQESLKRKEAWLLSAVETCELSSKVMDWKQKSCQMGEYVTQSYLMYLEETATQLRLFLNLEDPNLGELKVRVHEYWIRLQHVLGDIYKRLLDE